MYRIDRWFGEDDPNAFGVEVSGDSMVPKYEPGQVVIVDTRKKPSNGDFAVVGLTTYERFVKRWRQKGTKVFLESVNPEHPPVVVSTGAIKFAYKIVGSREK
jgi:SOS-response transcriptional repressor LexA